MATFPIGKLNPQTSTTGGVTTAVAKLNFPGFQEILDFTATGSESSVSVTVDGDTDKEYLIYVRNLNASWMNMVLNDAITGFGYQYIVNNAGTITAARSALETTFLTVAALSEQIIYLLGPTGFIKTAFAQDSRYSSGTTISVHVLWGRVYNSTSSITKIYFDQNGGNFTAGTRIVVYARRSNT